MNPKHFSSQSSENFSLHPRRNIRGDSRGGGSSAVYATHQHTTRRASENEMVNIWICEKVVAYLQ